MIAADGAAGCSLAMLPEVWRHIGRFRSYGFNIARRTLMV